MAYRLLNIIIRIGNLIKSGKKNKKGTSWKQELKNIIDKNIAASNNWSDFIFCMQEDNIM
mgnify:CR=1 FL=1